MALIKALKSRRNFTVGVSVHQARKIVAGVNRVFTATSRKEAMKIASEWSKLFIEIECQMLDHSLPFSVKLVHM